MEEGNNQKNVSPDMLIQRAKNTNAGSNEQNEPDESKESQFEANSSTIDDVNKLTTQASWLQKQIEALKNIIGQTNSKLVKTTEFFANTPLRYLACVLAFIWNKYKSWFIDVAYIEGDKAEPIFSGKRATFFVLASLIIFYVIYYGTVPLLKTFVHAYQATQTQTQHLFFGQPVYKADQGIYQVTACSEKTCQGGDNALVFDIPDNYYLDIKYTFTKGKGYDPEHEVVSAFNSAYQECTVTTYGKTPIIFNYVVGQYKWHPKILDKAVCSPVMNMATP